MIKKYSLRKYIAPAVVATSIAVFSPVLIEDVSAHGSADVEESTPATTIETSNEGSSNGSATILSNIGIQDLQQKLADNGQNLAVDGANGEETKDAVENFQSEKGIQVDGIVGKDTLNALNGDAGTNSNGNTNSNPSDADKDDPKAPAPDSTNSDDNTPAADGSAVDRAQDLVGTPYVFGGDNPNTGLDSSGFINAVFSDKDTSRTHAGMWANDGTKVSDPQPGDVVFFEGTYKDGVSHSGVYMGNGQMVHAGTEATGVEVTSTEIGYWSDRYIGAKRF